MRFDNLQNSEDFENVPLYFNDEIDFEGKTHKGLTGNSIAKWIIRIVSAPIWVPMAMVVFIFVAISYFVENIFIQLIWRIYILGFDGKWEWEWDVDGEFVEKTAKTKNMQEVK